jgi:hypothetical protein
MANLTRKARHIDLAAIENDVISADKLPFYKKWWLRLRGKNPALQPYLNKL